jgi:hypothetical protein
MFLAQTEIHNLPYSLAYEIYFFFAPVYVIL